MMPFRPDRHPAGILLWMAVAAMLVPGPTWSLAEAVDADSVPEKRTRESEQEAGPPVRILDIQLGSGGTLSGRVRDEQGRPLAGLTVVVSRARHVVARVKTDELGDYRVTGLVGGVYCVRAGSSVTIGRLWTTDSAPPRSRQRLNLAAGAGVEVRGQNGEASVDDRFDPIHRFGLDGRGGLDSFEITLLTTSMISLTLSAVMLSRIDELQDSIDRLSASN
ncbi:MAG TPA: hypothetical protein DCE47_09955 [Planctomycetaceae bacterium]|nr:hypothetical protein [Planctomycetaceae bacterium]HCD03498.1 hypothetical protein [Planctomycetaceae bacterium]